MNKAVNFRLPQFVGYQFVIMEEKLFVGYQFVDFSYQFIGYQFVGCQFEKSKKNLYT